MRISSLLLSHGTEGQILEPPHLRLEKLQVHRGGAAVVVTLGLLQVGTHDAEDGHAPPVHALHLDAGQLATAQEGKGPQEEVIGQEHALTSFRRSLLG
jgi:hypothetical protein